VQRSDKERVVEELAERLREAESLLVVDYRGLTNAQFADVRSKLREHGARLTVVKNSLTRRAAEAAGAEQVLALLEGPTAIAFLQTGGDPVAVAKALSDTAKDTKILSLRGGVLEGKHLDQADVEQLAKLPPIDVLKGQLVGVILAPLTQVVALVNAPLRDLVGLIDARIAQLGDSGESGEAGEVTSSEVATEQEQEQEQDVAEVSDDAATDGAESEPESGNDTETEEE
jgi:large subunit ribosomal protein L10